VRPGAVHGQAAAGGPAHPGLLPAARPAGAAVLLPAAGPGGETVAAEPEDCDDEAGDVPALCRTPRPQDGLGPVGGAGGAAGEAAGPGQGPRARPGEGDGVTRGVPCPRKAVGMAPRA